MENNNSNATDHIHTNSSRKKKHAPSNVKSTKMYKIKSNNSAKSPSALHPQNNTDDNNDDNHQQEQDCVHNNGFFEF